MLSSDRQPSEESIEITPQLLAVLTIERIAINASALSIDPSNWWFAIQDFDLALMSQMIASLSGTTQLGALKGREQQIMLEYINDRNPSKTLPLDRRGNAIEDQLASFKQLLDRTLDPRFAFVDNSQNPLSLSPAQKRDILKLHRFRNNLAHVRPMSWYLEIIGLARMALACTHAIEHLFKHSTQRIHLEEWQIAKTENNLNKISLALVAKS